MKNIILISSVICSLSVHAQNTIPTTTVTGALKINDSLNVSKNITAKGEVMVRDTLRAKKDVLVDGDVNIDGKLKVKGNTRFKDDVRLEKGFTFDGTNGLFRTPPTTTSGEVIQLGSNSLVPLPYYYCQETNTEPWNQFYYNGNFVSYQPTGSNTSAPQVNAAVRIGIAPWNGNGIIDVSGVNQNGIGNNGLDINYFCKRNTSINAGWSLNPANFIDGGTVFMGAKVDMLNSLKLGWTQSGNIDLNTSIEINQNTGNANGVKVQTWNSSVKAYSILRNDGKNTFVVYGDGRTQIGVGSPKTNGSAANAMLSVDGLILAKEIKVAIANTHWADYVFEKNYKLMSLKEVEKYISTNKHLPGVASTNEVQNNGIDLVETNAVLLKKIEELTLYLIEQNKRITKLEK
jgi:hypothetical protein